MIPLSKMEKLDEQIKLLRELDQKIRNLRAPRSHNEESLLQSFQIARLEILKVIAGISADIVESESESRSSGGPDTAPTITEKSSKEATRIQVDHATKLALGHPIIFAILRAVGGSITLSEEELRVYNDPQYTVEVLHLEYGGVIVRFRAGVWIPGGDRD